MKAIGRENSTYRRASVSYSVASGKVKRTPTPMFAFRRSVSLLSRNRSNLRQFASFQPPSLSLSSPPQSSEEAFEDPEDATGPPPERVPPPPEWIQDRPLRGERQNVYTDFSIYKTRGALQFKPVPPRIVEVNGYKTIQRQGSLLLQFAQSKGNRSYDWENKIIFSLSALELGQILGMPTQDHEFFHDPGMNSNEQSVVTKKLKISTTADNARFFNVRNQNKKDENQNKEVSVSLTQGEFEVFKILAQYLIPRLLAFDKVH